MDQRWPLTSTMSWAEASCTTRHTVPSELSIEIDAFARGAPATKFTVEEFGGGPLHGHTVT